MLDHIGRMTGREPKRWNIACDIVVNHYLKQDNIGRMPECGITDPALFAKGQGVVEVIYNLLESNEGQGQGQSTPSHDQMDAMQEADASEGQVQSKWKPLVMQAQAAAKQAGKLSGALERLVKQAVVSPPNWRQIMAEWMSRSAMGDQRTWSRPSRRMAAAGMYRPATYSEAIGELVIAVDCSGSVSPELLDKFMAHVRALCEDIQPKRIHIAYFHHTVFRVDSYENADDMVINITESGGTAFSPIFRRVDADGIDPVCCVVLTDLECSDYGPQPGYPVLWASTTDAKAPWGRTIRID
jgi:predicted metal-dependent peptidase